ncbi:MAG: hypothetical protein CMO55_28620 [Verrucomicrobiales bacterium]|nr:hypothetical protein [Verrucomicrobiales bacterium]
MSQSLSVGQATLDGAGVLKDLLQIPSRVSLIPDCSFAYTSVNFSANGQEGEVIRRRFVKQGEMWKEESYRPDGSLRIVNSYDGENYFTYIPTANQLAVSQNPKAVERFTVESFATNPLYTWSNVVFLAAHEKFKIPELEDGDLLEEELTKFQVLPSSAVVTSRGGEVGLESPEMVCKISYDRSEEGEVLVSEYTLRLKDPDGKLYDRISRKSMLDWRTEKVGEVDVIFPRRVEVDTFDAGKPGVSTGGSIFEYEEGTLVKGTGKLKKIDFQVPLSSVSNPRFIK